MKLFRKLKVAFAVFRMYARLVGYQKALYDLFKAARFLTKKTDKK